ncbi:hypothetical protein SpiGrapes_1083 [Sphaerochaeta pleomorpha str. Grapes]|uniref:DUF5723 domain-containing protein n=1 Tax=Sphaerochaeta pleomorpha (strain ATCC BAA-1885 / DSM 22778 / Grapes) TaxID=158190 RepID=G8QS45_SPHPG|nr:hypothetical protein [Sphaerochaeta pleomorpha]AEV28906.1 hypothetical protein SpiGrapes_1083 [Sphaerochaeta pleomorpha str. Grapes]
MHRRFIRIGIVCLVFLFFLSPLFAGEALVSTDQVTGYTIASYTFNVKGKTKEFALRNAIVPEKEPVFLSIEALVENLDAKKQTLDNKRIFSEVSYTYQLASYAKGVAYYDVHFSIDDAFTMLPLPYAKYDNDTTGLRIGMKLYDKNLFGTFADLYMVGHISQGNGGLSGWDNREDYLEMTVSSLPVGSSFLDFSFDYSNTKNSDSSGDFSFDIDWKNLHLFGIPFSINPSATFNPSSDYQTWNPTTLELITNLGPFIQSEALYSLSNQITYTASSENIYTLTYLRQHNLSLFSHPIDFNISAETNATIGDETISSLDLGTTLGTGFSLPLSFSLYSSLGAFLHYDPSLNPIGYSYLFSSNLSRSKINWQGNFRKGYSASLTYTTDIYPQEEYASSQYWQLEGHATWFLFASKHFNPSVRFTGFVSDTKKAFLPSDSDENLADYFRGILHSNKLLSADSDTYVAVLNMNLSMTFITLKNFAHTYASPFMDIGVLNDPDSVGKPLVLATAGAEGYVIFDKFPSFPIRGSLGVNLQDVKKAIDHEISMHDVEFEISIGMGLFF